MATNNQPNPKSFDQLLEDAISTYRSKVAITDNTVGGSALSFFETVAQMVYRAQGDIFQVLKDNSVDRSSGEALKRIAIQERVYPIPAKVTTGPVTITDTAFVKKTTKVYAGAFAPNVGSTVIKVSDTVTWPASGSIYIGRGTPNVEGPIAYSSITPVGGHYEINLSTPTSRYHNISEVVTLAQGGTRNIPKGTSVKTIGSGGANDIIFTTSEAAILLDGENTLTGVQVSAGTPGASSNVPRGAIKAFNSAPFATAAVTNELPFNNGRNPETDDEIKDRVKKARISRGLGTATAIENATLGITASDENATITSNNIVSDGTMTTLFIDNGQGYEEKATGIGLEFIVDSAIGGETDFQLSTGGNQTSVAKAYLESTNSAPFIVSPLNRLSLLIGGVASEHQFNVGDFKSDGSATAYEIVASVNSNSELLYTAATSNNGKKVTFTAKVETNEYIQVTEPTTGINASDALGLPINEINTLTLYKNRKLLEKDGRNAFLESAEQSTWSNTLASGETLIISVDGTAAITYTFTDADFVNEGTYSTLSKNNNLQSWINVINTKVTGITATIDGNKIKITSNIGTKTRASLNIDQTSTFVTKGIYPSTDSLSSTGKDSDYTLSRNTAQLKLKVPLKKGDNLTAGTEFTKARIQSQAIVGGGLTLTNDAYMWFLVDEPTAQIVKHFVIADSLMNVTKPSANVIRYTTTSANAFSGVQVGDYVVNWSNELNAANRLEGRVYACTSNSYDIRVTATEYAAAAIQTTVIWKEGLTFVRTTKPLQKIKIPAGSLLISDIANYIQASLYGATSFTQDDELIFVVSETEGPGGSILLATTDLSAKSLSFTDGDSDMSGLSHYAYFQTANKDGEVPSFVHTTISDDNAASPPNSQIGDFNSTQSLTVDPNNLVSFLNPYGVIKDAQPQNDYTQIKSIIGSAVNVQDKDTIRRLRLNDRFYVAEPLSFSQDDTFVVILDNQPTDKTFPIPLYRKATTNNTMPANSSGFRAYDSDSGATSEFNTYFGNTFNFSNYKVLMKARNALNPANNTVNQDSILYRAAIWGLAGEHYSVGYFYPAAANQALSHFVKLDSDCQLQIFLQSGPAVLNNIDSTTEWNVTVTPNSPVAGVDTVTYTYSGTGTAPSLAGLTAGNFATINNSGEFSPGNQGTFKISNSSPTSFSVRRPTGVAVNESNIATLTLNTIFLYEDLDTTAADINTYVNANMADYITSSILNDNGTSGSGVVEFSTYEDTNFVSESVYLKDGINWVSVSNLTAAAPNPQFSFKQSLDLPTISTATPNAYSFNMGEEVRLIPTTYKQVRQFISVLAVTGLTTLATVSNAEREQRLQITSEILGSSGSVQITGGNGNSIASPILGSANQIQGGYMRAIINRSAAAGLQAGSYVALAADQVQQKASGISLVTNVTITANSPYAGTSTIELLNREIGDTYFGVAKNNFKDIGVTFYVEKHGGLVCISWDGIGTNPNFTKTVQINGAGGGTISTTFTDGYTIYTAGTNRRFNEVQKGDIFTISTLPNVENNGTFTVLGVSNDGLSVVVDNTKGSSAASSAVASGNLTVTTEVQEGDTVEFGAPFSTLNRGNFKVIRRVDNSIYIKNTAAVEEVVTVVANPISFGGSATTQYNVTVPGYMRIEYNGNGTAPDFSDVKMGSLVTIGAGSSFNAGNKGTFTVVNKGVNFIEVANALATAQTGVTVSGASLDTFTAHQPAIKFFEYDTAIVGDQFVITGNVLSAANIGSHTIAEVINATTIVVNKIMTPQTAVGLGSNSTQVYIEESVKYLGYKRIYNIVVDPANSSRSILIFDTDNDYSKINDIGDVQLIGLSKLGFPEKVAVGTDSYKYNTGLIAEANRVVYGDPRDTITYPGVGAAGAEIFIKAPLVRRVQVSIAVRLNTGIPFTRVVEQVRNNVFALINSSPIGKPIAISSIVSVVESLNGVTAVAISSPLYNDQNDVIAINPNEKALVLDIVQDIIVNKIG